MYLTAAGTDLRVERMAGLGLQIQHTGECVNVLAAGLPETAAWRCSTLQEASLAAHYSAWQQEVGSAGHQGAGRPPALQLDECTAYVAGLEQRLWEQCLPSWVRAGLLLGPEQEGE